MRGERKSVRTVSVRRREASGRGNPGGQTDWEEDQELSDRQGGTRPGAQQARARLKPWVHSGRRMASLR